jgi:hypothetical protein
VHFTPPVIFVTGQTPPKPVSGWIHQPPWLTRLRSQLHSRLRSSEGCEPLQLVADCASGGTHERTWGEGTIWQHQALSSGTKQPWCADLRICQGAAPGNQPAELSAGQHRRCRGCAALNLCTGNHGRAQRMCASPCTRLQIRAQRSSACAQHGTLCGVLPEKRALCCKPYTAVIQSVHSTAGTPARDPCVRLTTTSTHALRKCSSSERAAIRPSMSAERMPAAVLQTGSSTKRTSMDLIADPTSGTQTLMSSGTQKLSSMSTPEAVPSRLPTVHHPPHESDPSSIFAVPWPPGPSPAPGRPVSSARPVSLSRRHHRHAQVPWLVSAGYSSPATVHKPRCKQ